MDGLRWLLLLIGLAVVVGVFFYTRKERDKPGKTASTPAAPALEDARRTPSIGNDSADSADSTDSADSVEAPEETPGREQKIITLRIVAADNMAFSGEDLILSLRGIGMRHGKFGIFHQYEGSDEGKVLFSAASLVEPGNFDLENIQEQLIPGISMFMVLPGAVDGPQIFDQMMATARALAQTLQAEMLDESGSTLSIQRQRNLREEIIQYEYGIEVT